MAEATFTAHGIACKVSIDVTEITGLGGPVYPHLKVPLHLDFGNPGPAQDERYVALSVECGIFLPDHSLKISDATYSTSISYPGNNSIWSPEFPLDPHRVAELEARRHGNLKLRLDFSFLVGVLRRISPNQKPLDVFVGFERSTCQVYAEVPQSHWVDRVLPALGSSRYLIVEIPMRNEQTAQAWTLIDKAEKAFAQWDTKGVFAHCREAADALTHLVAESAAKGSFAREQRWERAAKEFKHFASLDLHLEEIRAKGGYAPDQVKIEKADSECLLIFTKALAKFAEELVG